MSWKWLRPKWRVEGIDAWSGQVLHHDENATDLIYYWRSAAENKASRLNAVARLFGSNFEYRVVENDR